MDKIFFKFFQLALVADVPQHQHADHFDPDLLGPIIFGLAAHEAGTCVDELEIAFAREENIDQELAIFQRIGEFSELLGFFGDARQCARIGLIEHQCLLIESERLLVFSLCARASRNIAIEPDRLGFLVELQIGERGFVRGDLVLWVRLQNFFIFFDGFLRLAALKKLLGLREDFWDIHMGFLPLLSRHQCRQRNSVLYMNILVSPRQKFL